MNDLWHRLVLLAGLLVSVSPAGAVNELAKLLPNDGVAGDHFGHGVAIDGDTVVVGAPWESELGDHAGAAYVFQYTGTTWSQVAKLTASDATSYDNFGESVSIDGDTIVVGAVDNVCCPLQSSGTAYVFVRPAEGWADATETARLCGSATGPGDGFARNVAISGNTVVASCNGSDEAVADGGAAYVFVRPVGGWVEATETARLTASDAADGDYLGLAVGIDDGVIVAGATGSDVAGPTSGAAYVFVRPVSGWVDATETAKLIATDGESGDRLGWAVAVAGDTVVATAPWHANGYGAAYVYARPAGGWADTTQTAKLTVRDFQRRYLGHRVAAFHNRVVITAEHDASSGTSTGSAYLFTATTGEWADRTLGIRLAASDGASHDFFGCQVGLDGGLGIIGARHDDDLGENSGAAYVFCVPASDCNHNGQCDGIDLIDGTSLDGNGDGRPDECVEPENVPTLSEWGQLLLALLLVVGGVVVVRRRQRPDWPVTDDR